MANPITAPDGRGEAAIRRDMAVAFLCDNLLQGRDPFAGFPKFTAVGQQPSPLNPSGKD